jgi:hypothetical protein
MSHILRMATIGVMLAFAATGVAQARGANFDRGSFGTATYHQGYAGPAYSSTNRPLWPWYVPQLGVQGLACDMPSSTCSNDERIND